jgi:hypothetical protein
LVLLKKRKAQDTLYLFSVVSFVMEEADASREETLRHREEEWHDNAQMEAAASDHPAEPVKTAGFNCCVLCNKALKCDEMDAHTDLEHRELREALLHSKLCRTPITPASATDHADFAEFLLDTLREVDKGPDAYQFIQYAREQVDALVRSKSPMSHQVHLFGSSVALGCWDGHSDADLAAIMTEPDGTYVPATRQQEEAFVKLFTTIFRNAGILFDELSPIRNARVPLVKRKCLTKVPLNCSRFSQPYSVVVRFQNARAIDDLSRKMKPQMQEHLKQLSGKTSATSKPTVHVFHFQDGADALLFFSTSKVPGVFMTWETNGREPEMYTTDFDLTFRLHGLRNSWLLRAYYEQHHVFRAGYVFLKRWSSCRGINNSRVGYLTSYAMQ